MKNIRAIGICAVCGERSKAKGADEQDARYLLMHFHGSDFGHCFEGSITFTQVELKTEFIPAEEEPTHRGKRRRKR